MTHNDPTSALLVAVQRSGATVFTMADAYRDGMRAEGAVNWAIVNGEIRRLYGERMVYEVRRRAMEEVR